MLDACASSDVVAKFETELEEEITVNLPIDVLPLRNLGLVNPVEEIYPPHYEPPLGRFLRNYIAECRQRARDLKKYEREKYADTVYQKGRRLCLRLWAHMKKNATSRPWEDYQRGHYPEY